jgi:hypothetical protein
MECRLEWRKVSLEESESEPEGDESSKERHREARKRTI